MPPYVFWAVPPYFIGCVWCLFFSHCLASDSQRQKSLKMLKLIILSPSLKMYWLCFQIFLVSLKAVIWKRKHYYFTFFLSLQIVAGLMKKMNGIVFFLWSWKENWRRALRSTSIFRSSSSETPGLLFTYPYVYKYMFLKWNTECLRWEKTEFTVMDLK